MPDINVFDSVSVAEDITVTPDPTPTGYVADIISLSEYVNVDIAGAGDQEVADEKIVSANIGAAGIFTKAVVPMPVSGWPGFLNVSVSGTFTATVVLQRSFDRGVTWHTYASYTTVTETYIEDKEVGVLYRIGIPTSYTSGTAVCRLGVGG